MKSIILLLSISILLGACQPNQSANNGTKNALQMARSIIIGNWYQANYIDSIRKSKSPFRSKKDLSMFVELQIDAGDSTSDSLRIGATGVHEGGDFILYFKPGVITNSFPTNIGNDNKEGDFFELSYNILRSDTTLILLRYNKRKEILGQTKYLKATNGAESVFQSMVNRTLFSGKYKLTDSAGKVSDIKFTDEGNVTGLPLFKNYEVITDFVAEPANSVDEVCFDIQTSNQHCYAFESIADTLKLYEVRESPGQDTVHRERLAFTFVKQQLK
jgi:hypothetical protein